MKIQYGMIVFATIAAVAISTFDFQIRSTGNEIVSRQTDDHQRTRFFPKEENFPQSLPPRENLWVFLLAGQSNMAGRGMVEPQDTLPSERILTVNRKGELVLAKEPLHFYEPTRTGLDCGVSFARTLIANIPDSVSILLLPSAVGGSSISQWLGDSSYRDVRLMTNASGLLRYGKRRGVIKGILWHQGETDALKPERIRAYSARLEALADTFRTIVNDERLPLLIGELGSFSADHERWKEINKRIRSVAAGDFLVYVVPTADLNHKGDYVHFDSESIRLLGKRFAEEYLNTMRFNDNE